MFLWTCFDTAEEIMSKETCGAFVSLWQTEWQAGDISTAHK